MTNATCPKICRDCARAILGAEPRAKPQVYCTLAVNAIDGGYPYAELMRIEQASGRRYISTVEDGPAFCGIEGRHWVKRPTESIADTIYDGILEGMERSAIQDMLLGAIEACIGDRNPDFQASYTTNVLLRALEVLADTPEKKTAALKLVEEFTEDWRKCDEGLSE